MKVAIKLLLKILLLLLIVYGSYFSLYMAADDEIIFLKDLSNNKNIHIFSAPINFIRQGVMPWKYTISKISVDHSAMINISIKIPALSALDDDIYAIKLCADMGYQIDKTNLPDILHLNSIDDIENYITKKATAITWAVLENYIEPVYNKSRILSNEKIITDTVTNELIRKTKDSGIVLNKVDFILPGYYPDDRIYTGGVAKNEALRDLAFENKKDEIRLNKQLIEDRKNYELYHEKLLRISTLIKDNPDILKFIYIDKIGKDIKVIISSDKTGLPAMFDESLDKAKSDKKGDVDNFR
ncbi:MAG: hypothetical protein FWH53_08640 [Leptospirales bacterium]|nr:hypothetical protein [Leptospirales bacterium]